MNEDNAVTNAQFKSYWSSDMAKMLDISTSTLRKWSLAMESEGYPFIRDEHDRRAYLERDIVPLHKMRELLSDGMSMENAAKAVVLRFSEQILDTVTTPVTVDNERSSERYIDLVNKFEAIEQENLSMRKQLGRIEDLLEAQEQRMNAQNDSMTVMLRELLETKRMIAAADERSIWKKLKFWK